MEQFSTNKWKYVMKFDDYCNMPLSTDIHGNNRFNIGDAVEVSLSCDNESARGKKGVIVPKLNDKPECLGVKLNGTRNVKYIDKQYLIKISTNDLREENE